MNMMILCELSSGHQYIWNSSVEIETRIFCLICSSRAEDLTAVSAPNHCDECDIIKVLLNKRISEHSFCSF